MNTLGLVNILLVGLWAGMYLFTTFVVSPAFREVFPVEAMRHANRRVLGRYYARVNGPLSAVMLLVACVQGLRQGFSAALGLEIGALLLIGALVGWHVRRAETQTPPQWLTHITLLLSLSVCALSIGAAL